MVRPGRCAFDAHKPMVESLTAMLQALAGHASSMLQALCTTSHLGEAACLATDRSAQNQSVSLLQARIVADHADFCIVNKPPGVPVAPTVDNLLEDICHGAAQVHPLALSCCGLGRQVQHCKPSQIERRFLGRLPA